MARVGFTGFLAGALMGGAGLLGVAQAAPISPSNAAYGDYFLGAWNGNLASKCSPGTSSGDCLETLIAAKFTSTEPFASLGDIDPLDPLLNQLNPVGNVNSPGTTPTTDGRLSVTAAADGRSGTWTYLLEPVPAPVPSPGDDPVDFYLVLKNGPSFTVFYYDNVDPTDPLLNNGLWSLKPSDLGIAPCGETFADGADCIPIQYVGPPTNRRPSDPAGISHIEAYWPPSTTGGDPGCTDPNGCVNIPEPATLVLLGAGLAGLGLVRRRSRF